MGITISAEQRDALYSLVLDELTAFDDLRMAYASEDLEAAHRLGRKVSDGLRLIVDGGLGWGAQATGPVELTLPPEDLRRALVHLRRSAVNLYDAMRPEQEQVQEEFDEVKRAQDACTEVLGQIKS
jgi:hypothetical protein